MAARSQSGLLLLVPFFALLLLFWGIPLGGGALMSVQSNTVYGEARFVGLENFARLFTDPDYWTALKNTAVYLLGSAFFILPLALSLALLLRRCFPALKPVLSFTLLMPGLTPPTVLAILFLLVFHGKHGLLNQFLTQPWGLPPIRWLIDPDFILPALLIQGLWRWTGFISFFFLTALDALPREYFEIAKLEGSKGWQTLWHVTLPLVRHVVLFAAIYLFIDAIALFSGAYVLLGGSGGTLNAGLLLVNYSYQKFSFGQFGLATAAGLSVLPVMLLLLWLLLIRSVSRRVG